MSDWVLRAACKNHHDPAIFFPNEGEAHRAREARALCRSCPVREECLDTAIKNGEVHGIWGGQSMGGRRRMATQRICEICGEKFHKTHPAQRYCNELCASLREAENSRRYYEANKRGKASKGQPGTTEGEQVA